jgi:hypothetical protein
VRTVGTETSSFNDTVAQAQEVASRPATQKRESAFQVAAFDLVAAHRADLSSCDSRPFRPDVIGPRRKRLVRTEICAVDRGENEIFGWYGTARQSPEQGQLPSVGHCIRKGALQKDFWSHIEEIRSYLDVSSNIGERFMKVRYSSLEIGKYWRAVSASDEQRSRVTQQTVHVPNQLVGSSDLGGGSKLREVWGSAPK